MTREELWLAAIAGLEGVNPPDYPVWHYEQMLAAIYDAVTGAADPRPFPERSWHLDEFLYAVYCAVAGLDDPGCPAPTCRIEEFWKGIYDAATGDDSASVPNPVWRIEEFLSGIFDVASGWGASVLTETGNAPLTLANAIARAIKSLTQTGLCTQDGTPTPDAPVDIMTNNGPLRYGALGMNLLDPSAANTILGYYITKADGEVKPAESNFMFAGYMPVEAGKTYVAYGRAKTGNDLSDYNRIAWYDSEKTWIAGADYTQNRIAVATAPVNAAYARFSCNPSGTTTATVTQELVDSYNWIFAEGTAEIVPFEPFVGGIYPDGTPEVLTVFQNLYDERTMFTTNPMEITGSTLYWRYAEGSTAAAILVPCKPNTEYTLKYSGGNRCFIGGFINEVDLNPSESIACDFNIFSNSSAAVSPKTFTTPANCNYLAIGLKNSAGTAASDITVFETAQTASDIPMLLGVGDYKDEVELIAGIKTGKVGIYVFTGEETLDTSTAYGDCVLFAKSRHKWDADSNCTPICTHFVGLPRVSSGQKTVGTCFFNSYTHFYFRVEDNDKTAFKAFLAAQYANGTPVIVLYRLAEATTESVAGQPLHTVAGTNTVSVTAEVSPVALTCEYYGASS